MEPGYIFNGRYQIISLLGEGGMANVYLANDLILNRQVALKVLRLDLRNDANVMRHFQHEAHAVTELVDPNIVTIYDVGEDHGLQYLVMEYVQGMDLKHYIKTHFPIPYQRVVDIMMQITSAVQVAHEHHIIHRDLKPQNILIDNTGHIKITDFGIAVALSEDSLTQTNSVLGSVHYLSPEQARGGMATPRSDIYSMGIILYEMLTGSVPFEGESAVSIALKHFQNNIPSVRAFDHNIPQALENVVLKATCKDASERYASAAAMQADLKTALSPQRLHEAKFKPTRHYETEETKIIPDISGVLLNNQHDLDKTIVSVKHHDKQSPATPPKIHHRFRWLILLTVLLIGVFTTIMLVLNNSEVKVPDISGMTRSQATNTLIDNRLQLGKVTYQNSYQVVKGRIISIKPTEGKKVKPHTKIAVVLSKGALKYRLANYVGQPYDMVAKKLSKLGFAVEKIEAASNIAGKGTIISQSITSGTKVMPKRTTISFTVSSGRNVFAVPDLTNYTQRDVENYANTVGLTLVINTAYSNSVPSGLVMGQSPVANTNMSVGNLLTVTISKGPAPNAHTASSTITSKRTYQNSSSANSVLNNSRINSANINNNSDLRRKE